MVNIPMLLIGLTITYVGWVFYRDPQTGFQIYNFPFTKPGTKGLTENGKTPYRIQGIFIMSLGAFITLAALFV